ncbi:dihydrodipicolinate reductase [Streptococcus sanguinis SK330]|uniref:Dihydrodipicolinate reductase n=1 Tax=Streptococcus sanguinis SK330 TaxID=888813 RepID=F2C972_STRSA|nr:dihydrodipicolinate reductase [Streptococcus sanguinis SK330]
MTNVTILHLETKASKYWNNLIISLLHEDTKKPAPSLRGTD